MCINNVRYSYTLSRPALMVANPASQSRTTRLLVPSGHTWASIAAGESHTCAVTTAGDAYCWGYNGFGQFGDGTTTNRSTPVLVSGGQTWASVTSGWFRHTCGVTTGGEAYCWGLNSDGQLGDGTGTNRSVPVKVTIPW